MVLGSGKYEISRFGGRDLQVGEIVLTLLMLHHVKWTTPHFTASMSIFEMW